MKILIADDDPQLLRALRITLGAHGYDIVTAHDGPSALDAAVAHRPDLVMLDLGMPRLDGLGVITGLRGWTRIPILVLSARTGSADKASALDCGADDYVTKPFSIDDVLTRIRALTRPRPSSDDETIVKVGRVSVDLVAKRVSRPGHSSVDAIRLTPTEWRILEVLLRNPDRLITRDVIVSEVWGPHHTSDSGFLHLYVTQLRKKLEPEPSAPRYLLTEEEVGYRFHPDPPT